MCSVVSDEDLADKFKREHAEQFHILVRMHLSFVLDLNTDDNECFSEKTRLKKWNLLVPFVKKSKARGVMEGAPLTQEGICQAYQLIEFLKKEQNIKTEGVFRRTGSLSRQQELRNLLNQGITLNLERGTYSVHDCASVLKGFLAELPDPLLTEAHFPAYCQIAELCGIIENSTQEGKLLEALQLLLLLLPTENKVLLRDILDLLNLTASHDDCNRMSADNLAKLFTPHLLCPRKLSPEQLHVNSQMLCGIVSFMITHSSEIFRIPQKLIVDFRARYEQKKALSPSKMNESVNDAAKTVFTFVDQERTAKENESNPTETALAQLYAHIQSLPESSKKRKLVKQFNKENGHGTPLQVIRSNMPKNKSLGDSIKKHIFQKSIVKSVKKTGALPVRSSSEEILNTPQHQTFASKARLFCTNCDSSTDLSNDETSAKKFKQSTLSTENLATVLPGNSPKIIVTELVKRSRSEPDLSTENAVDLVCNNHLTSTPACLPVACPDVMFTPEFQDRESMSPITRSTQRMSRAMQETMMTPRSRKPVLLVSGTNIKASQKIEQEFMDNVTEESSEFEDIIKNPNLSDSGFKRTKSESYVSEMQTDEAAQTQNNETQSSLTSTFREYLSTRSIQTTDSPADLSFSSRTDDFNSNDFRDLSDNKMSESLLRCLNGNEPSGDGNNSECDESVGEKQLVLKPKQYDQNGQPIVFETSF